MVLVYRVLKGMKNWVEAYFLADGLKSFGLKIGNELLFVVAMKSIDNFIRIADKPVNTIDRISESFMKRPYTAAKRGAVLLGYEFTALKTGFIIQGYIYARHRFKNTNSNDC